MVRRVEGWVGGIYCLGKGSVGRELSEEGKILKGDVKGEERSY